MVRSGFWLGGRSVRRQGFGLVLFVHGFRWFPLSLWANRLRNSALGNRSKTHRNPWQIKAVISTYLNGLQWLSGVSLEYLCLNTERSCQLGI
jgi:hypothetical protein